MIENTQTKKSHRRMRPEDTFEPSGSAFVGAVIAWMHSEGLTREAAATKTGLSFFTISELIGGARPSTKTLVKLAQAGVLFDQEILKAL
jgi:hypothetical protein